MSLNYRFIEVFVGLFFWIILPMVIGMLFLPIIITSLVKNWLYKNKKDFPSFAPFWMSIIALVFVMNWVWTNYFNGRLFYEWDNGLTQYTLVSYQNPALWDRVGPSWIASGWQLWHLYLLWLGITAVIYTIGTSIALLANKNHKHFLLYKNVLIKSSLVMLVVGSFIALLLYDPIF